MNQIDFNVLSQNLDTSSLMGCDSSFANIFLYQKKYNTTLQIHDNILFRYNQQKDGSIFFYFPIPIKTNVPPKNDESESFIKTALTFILDNFPQPAFHLITQEQKNLIDSCLSQNFPNRSINWNSDRGDADYLYLQTELSELHGPVLQKKKNHINRFMRTYENRWSFKNFNLSDSTANEQNFSSIAQDILFVEEQWFTERNGQENPDLLAEFEIIKNALNNAKLLKLQGGVLYIDEKPVAMTLASPISPLVLDIHFEKALSLAAKDGAYAVINNLFAKTCTDYKYLNREEDLGIEGLRKAKLSYKPAMLLNKFFGSLN